MNGRRLWAVMLKELRQMRRDRITLAMIVGIPVAQLLLFGYAINTNLRDLPAGIADQAGTAASRALVMDIVATTVVRPVRFADTPQALMDDIRRGEYGIGIVVPADFERRRAEGRAQVQILVDGTDNSMQGAAAQLVQVPVEDAARKASPATRRLAENPVAVPGLIGVILTMTMVLFTGVSIVRERERGNMELLIATPVSSAELMTGKVLPYIVIGLVQTTLVLLLGMWLFQVPMNGKVVHVYVAAVLLIVANLALGLLISTAARSQFQAMQITFFVFLPSILLSGFMFPFAGMPVAVQWFAEVLPLTHFLRLVRGIMLRGASLWELWPEVLALCVFTAIMMGAAILRFRKRLD